MPSFQKVCEHMESFPQIGSAVYKILLLGDNNVGKTTLFHRFCHGEYQFHDATIGHDFSVKEIVVGDNILKLQLWDTPGHHRFSSVNRMYCSGCAAAVVFYDLSNWESLRLFQFWLGLLPREEPNCSIYICGTKKDAIEIDLDKCDLVQEVAEMYDIPERCRFLTSSKSGEGITEMFHSIGRDILQREREATFFPRNVCCCS